jgi:hypothetical protein
MAYFFLDDVYSQGYESAWARYFSECKTRDGLILAKNVDILYSPRALERLRQHNPACKLIVVLRNPVDRAYSAFWFARLNGQETVENFYQAVWLDPARYPDLFSQATCSYLERGLYAKYINQVYEVFPASQVQVYLFDDFQQRPAEICRNIFAVLGVRLITIETQQQHNRSSLPRFPAIAKAMGQRKYSRLRALLKRTIPDARRDHLRAWIQKRNRVPFSYPPMNPDTRDQLIAFFKPHNRELEQLLGIDLSAWDR